MKTETKYLIRRKRRSLYVRSPDGGVVIEASKAYAFSASELKSNRFYRNRLKKKLFVLIPVQVEVEVKVKVEFEPTGFTTTCNICGNKAQSVFYKGDDWGFHGRAIIYCTNQECDNSEDIETIDIRK